MATDKFGRNIVDKEDIGLSDKDIYNDSSILDILHEKLMYVNEFKVEFKETELQKLVEYLDKHDIPYDYIDKNSIEINTDLNQIDREADSFGTVTLEENGKLSVTGALANGVKDTGLTAKEVIDRLGGRDFEMTQTVTQDPHRDEPGGGAGGAVNVNVIQQTIQEKKQVCQEQGRGLLHNKTQSMDR